MKHLKLCLGLVSFSLFFQCIDAQGLLICVVGSSCSGKTTIVNKFLKRTSGFWQPVSMDDPIGRIPASADPGQVARELVVKRAAKFISRGFPVICDLAFESQQDWDWFFKKFPNTRIVKVFVDCTLPVLVNRLESRKCRRTVDQIINFFSKNFSLKTSDPRLSSVCYEDVLYSLKYAEKSLSEDGFKFLAAYVGRFFNIAQGKQYALGFEFGSYDLVVNNSAENAVDDCVAQILKFMTCCK